MDVSRPGDVLRQQATVENEPPPQWLVTIDGSKDPRQSAPRKPAVVRINPARLILAVSVVAIMTLLLADPTRGPHRPEPVDMAAPAAPMAAAGPAAPVAVPAAQVIMAPAVPTVPAAHLVVDAVPPGKGDRLRLGVSVAGPTEGAVVELSGLPVGWTVSPGRPIGADGWRLLAPDLGDAEIRAPQDFVGAIDLGVELRLANDALADSRAVRREWAPHDEPLSPAKEAAENANDEPDPTHINELCRRGEALLAAGDIAAARLFLERAARAGNPRAVFVLGTTYDPAVLKYLGVRGVPPDVARARNWYEKAKELGYPEAPRLLGSLGPSDGAPPPRAKE
jgi:hypothetical protein